jgi:hypothetical protein
LAEGLQTENFQCLNAQTLEPHPDLARFLALTLALALAQLAFLSSENFLPLAPSLSTSLPMLAILS